MRKVAGREQRGDMNVVLAVRLSEDKQPAAERTTVKYSPVLCNNLSPQIIRPPRLIDTVRPRTNIIPKLDIVPKLRDRLDLDKGMSYCLRLAMFVKLWSEEDILLVLCQTTDELRE
jgi:hypothetical protein